MATPRALIIWTEHDDADDSYSSIAAAARDAVKRGWRWSGAAFFDGEHTHDRRAEMARQCGLIRDEIAEAAIERRVDREHIRAESAASNFI